MSGPDLSNYIAGDWAEIPVYRKSRLYGMAKVDFEDYDRLIGTLWRTHNGYAVRRVGPGVEFMHRAVLNLPKGKGTTDHINRNRLDNRTANLRVVTQAENNQNLTPRTGGTSVYRGVSWNTQKECWVARTVFGGKLQQAYTNDELEAARIAAAWRRENLPFSAEAMA